MKKRGIDAETERKKIISNAENLRIRERQISVKEIEYEKMKKGWDQMATQIKAKDEKLLSRSKELSAKEEFIRRIISKEHQLTNQLKTQEAALQLLREQIQELESKLEKNEKASDANGAHPEKKGKGLGWSPPTTQNLHEQEGHTNVDNENVIQELKSSNQKLLDEKKIQASELAEVQKRVEDLMKKINDHGNEAQTGKSLLDGHVCWAKNFISNISRELAITNGVAQTALEACTENVTETVKNGFISSQEPGEPTEANSPSEDRSSLATPQIDQKDPPLSDAVDLTLQQDALSVQNIVKSLRAHLDALNVSAKDFKERSSSGIPRQRSSSNLQAPLGDKTALLSEVQEAQVDEKGKHQNQITQLKESQKRIESLAEEVATDKKEIAHLNGLLLKNKKRLRELERKSGSWIEQEQLRRDEIKNMENRIEELEAKVNDQATLIHDKGLDCEKLQARIEQLEKMLEKQTEENAKKDKKIKALNKQLVFSQSDFEAAQSRASTFLEKNRSMKKTLIEAREQDKKQRATIREQQQTISDLEEGMQHAKQQLKTKSRMGAIDEMKEEEIRVLKMMLEAAKREAETKEHEKQMLKRKLQNQRRSC